MKAYQILLIVFSVLIYSCAQEEILPDKIGTQSGSYGPFDVGTHWEYQVYGNLRDNLYEGEVQLENSGTVTIDERNYIIREASFLRYHEGKYFSFYQDEIYFEGSHEELYLDENLNVGDFWIDTVLYESGLDHVYRYKILQKSSFEITTLRETMNDAEHQFPREIFTYQKNIGLVKQVSSWDNGEITWRLISKH